MTKLSVCCLALALGGCMPVSGPSSQAVNSGVSNSGPQYAFIKLSSDVVDKLTAIGPEPILDTFGNKRPPPEIKFGIGDVVTVTIFEAAAGGLFIPTEAGVRPGNFVTLPNEPVDTAGNISVPYAGAVKAAGRTATEVQQEIVNAIKNRAIDPQATVSLATQNTSLISVLGEVNSPSRFPALPGGEHVLDAVTRAGGIKDQGYESWLVLERGGTRATVPFGSLIYNTADNIWVWPGDTIYVYRQPQTFVAFGASGQQGQFNFDMWRITLAEAVAKAGGLLDVQADPASVYLYRREPRAVAQQLGVDVTKYDGPTVPVIYNVNFADPGGYFLATKFEMRDKDVIYAANSSSVQIAKFLQFVGVAINTTNDAVSLGVNAEDFRILKSTPSTTAVTIQ